MSTVKNYTNYPEYEKRKKEVIQWLLNEGHNYCALPYTHMAIEANGDIRPCCVGEKFKGLNIKNKTIDEVLNDPQRQKFIDVFDKSMKSSLCNACWKDNAKHSMRVQASTKFDVIQDTINAMENKTSQRTRSLKWLEIKPGNRCNLKCRICGVHNSSQWSKDEYQYRFDHGLTDKKFKDSTEFEYTSSCDWIDNKEFWTDVKSFKEISTIHFMGGEPFMVLEHFNMLEKIIQDKDIDNTNIIIRYNTNGTYMPNKKQLDIWKQFNRVILSISIDDIGERFEYQRSLAKWNEVRNNLIDYKKLGRGTNKFDAVLDPCVSIFNVWWVDQIEKEFNDLGYTFKSPQRHFAHGPYDARLLPKEVKNKLIKKYKNKSVWQDNVAEFLMSKKVQKRTDLKDTFNKIEFFDKLRKENFKQINNTLYNEIRKHSNGIIT
tara:strand:+ start:2276 stop:3568 length:1293 start_codon:yes stop_codon:yes gene_type:complete